MQNDSSIGSTNDAMHDQQQHRQYSQTSQQQQPHRNDYAAAMLQQQQMQMQQQQQQQQQPQQHGQLFTQNIHSHDPLVIYSAAVGGYLASAYQQQEQPQQIQSHFGGPYTHGSAAGSQSTSAPSAFDSQDLLPTFGQPSRFAYQPAQTSDLSHLPTSSSATTQRDYAPHQHVRQSEPFLPPLAPLSIGRSIAGPANAGMSFVPDEMQTGQQLPQSFSHYVPSQHIGLGVYSQASSSHQPAQTSSQASTRPSPQQRTSGSSSMSDLQSHTTSGGFIELESPSVALKVAAKPRYGPPSLPTRSPYSSSGIDFGSLLRAVLTRDTSRAKRTIEIGSIDLSVAFLAVDCQAPDMNIFYASPSFYALTGYSPPEVINTNCRFLQSPFGQMNKGEQRRDTQVAAVNEMRENAGTWDELQVQITNYRKGGAEFTNLITIIPIPDPWAKTFDPDALPRYLVGLQVDISHGFVYEDHIVNNMYAGSFELHGMPKEPGLAGGTRTLETSETLRAILGTVDEETTREKVVEIMLSHNTDFVVALSLAGEFMAYTPSFGRLLGWSRRAALAHTVIELCHPADRAALQLRFKTVGKTSMEGGPPARLLFRIRVGPDFNLSQTAVGDISLADQQGYRYTWVECTAQKHPEQSKNKQSLIVSGRRVLLPPQPVGGLAGVLAWALIDRRGTVLLAGPAPLKEQQSMNLLDVDPTHVVDASPLTTDPLVSPTSATVGVFPALVSSLHGPSLVPAVGQSFWDIAPSGQGKELLQQRINIAPPNGMPDAQIILAATGEPASVAMSFSQDRFLALVRAPGDWSSAPFPPSASSLQLPAPDLGDDSGDAPFNIDALLRDPAGELGLLNAGGWQRQLNRLRIETDKLRQQLVVSPQSQPQSQQRTASSSGLGKRARD